jgi:hypothetical protein
MSQVIVSWQAGLSKRQSPADCFDASIRSNLADNNELPVVFPLARDVLSRMADVNRPLAQTDFERTAQFVRGPVLPKLTFLKFGQVNLKELPVGTCPGAQNRTESSSIAAYSDRRAKDEWGRRP